MSPILGIGLTVACDGHAWRMSARCVRAFKLYLLLLSYLCDLKLAVECERTPLRHLEEFMAVKWPRRH